MKNWIFFFVLFSGLNASGAGLPGFDPAYPRPATEPWNPPSGSDDEPGVSDGYPGIPHPEPGFPDGNCVDLLHQMQMLQELIKSLEAKILRLESSHRVLDTCENGVERIRLALQNYKRDGGKDLHFQGGRTEFVRLFSDGYLKSIPEWYFQVHSVQNEIKCVIGR
jgi:hypothetical protein